MLPSTSKKLFDSQRPTPRLGEVSFTFQGYAFDVRYRNSEHRQAEALQLHLLRCKRRRVRIEGFVYGMSASLVQCSGRCSLSSAWSTSRRSNVEFLHVPSDQNPSHQVTGTNLDLKLLSLEACLEASRQSSKCRANAPSLNFKPSAPHHHVRSPRILRLKPKRNNPKHDTRSPKHPQRNLEDLAFKKPLAVAARIAAWALGFSWLLDIAHLGLGATKQSLQGLIEVSSRKDVSSYHQFSGLPMRLCCRSVSGLRCIGFAMSAAPKRGRPFPTGSRCIRPAAQGERRLELPGERAFWHGRPRHAQRKPADHLQQ